LYLFRLHEELAALRSESQKKITLDEQRNTEKFLSLALPPSHNAGMSHHSGGSLKWFGADDLVFFAKFEKKLF
jgi:hypothetical protein